MKDLMLSLLFGPCLWGFVLYLLSFVKHKVQDAIYIYSSRFNLPELLARGNAYAWRFIRKRSVYLFFCGFVMILFSQNIGLNILAGTLCLLMFFVVLIIRTENFVKETESPVAI